jgi:zinc transport system substrate-binding protein
MAEIVSSRAYLRIGKIGFEVTWMDKIQMLNGSLAVYDLSEGIKWEEEDPHIWNSFEGARVIASNTLKACIELDPDRASQYEENYEGLLRDIRVREERVRKLLSPLSGHAFIIYHPTLTYFAREFDLVQLAIEEHGKEPTPGDMYRLIDRAKVLHARTAFIQQEFDIKNLHTVARESGATIALLHPLTYRPLDELVRIACLLAP